MPIPSIRWRDMRQKGSWICLQTHKRTVPQGRPLRVLVPHGEESGHIASDGPERVEQGCLHSGLEEQQVHVNLL